MPNTRTLQAVVALLIVSIVIQAAGWLYAAAQLRSHPQRMEKILQTIRNEDKQRDEAMERRTNDFFIKFDLLFNAWQRQQAIRTEQTQRGADG